MTCMSAGTLTDVTAVYDMFTYMCGLSVVKPNLAYSTMLLQSKVGQWVMAQPFNGQTGIYLFI